MVKEFIKKVLSKLASIKVWICIWACWLISFIVVKKMIEFTTLALLLGSVPLAVIGANVGLDYIWSKK